VFVCCVEGRFTAKAAMKASGQRPQVVWHTTTVASGLSR
jgi:hypothetical protein